MRHTFVRARTKWTWTLEGILQRTSAFSTASIEPRSRLSYLPGFWNVYENHVLNTRTVIFSTQQTRFSRVVGGRSTDHMLRVGEQKTQCGVRPRALARQCRSSARRTQGPPSSSSKALSSLLQTVLSTSGMHGLREYCNEDTVAWKCLHLTLQCC